MTVERRRRAPVDHRDAVLDPAVAGLFDDDFVRSCDLFETYIDTDEESEGERDR